MQKRAGAFDVTRLDFDRASPACARNGNSPGWYLYPPPEVSWIGDWPSRILGLCCHNLLSGASGGSSLCSKTLLVLEMLFALLSCSGFVKSPGRFMEPGGTRRAC